ncbi:hypothetical protein UFOVP699_52 [uncultured Caudovirales phage]|uniref:Uncharacterized protein n=1 Tax=uncultured Caudovirales phage TaxID=2100421 RepID=A0A6J5NNP2_9CAUD|nr:hypothetical protein UFOVP699_52 [uncultured Caudovirales phage]
MNTAQDFVNWLEGFLDACKNSPSPQQIREVRKKMTSLPKTEDRLKVNRSTGEVYNSLWSNSVDPVPVDHFSTISLVPPGSNIPNNGPLDEEFMAAIERNKSASTLEELAD